MDLITPIPDNPLDMLFQQQIQEQLKQPAIDAQKQYDENNKQYNENNKDRKKKDEK